MNKSDIGIVVFTYSRLDHTKITLEELAKNDGFSDYAVTIFSDGPKLQHKDQVQKVRDYLKEFKTKYKNVSVIERKENLGLERSIIEGITEAFKKYSAVISIEDDIKTSPVFLEYMFTLLNKYENKKEVGSISGYAPPSEKMEVPSDYQYDIYFAPRTSSWGWATWKDRWEDVDWKVSDFDKFKRDINKQKEFNKGGKDLSKMLIKQVELGIDTWDIQWCYHNFKKGMYTIYPITSYVENIGNDGTGVHCGKTSGFSHNMLNEVSDLRIPDTVILDSTIERSFKKSWELTPKMYYELITDRLFKIIKTNINK